MTPPAPCYLRHFQIFDKIDSFPKKFECLYNKRRQIAICTFGELSNLYLIVLLTSFFPLLLWITAENRTIEPIWRNIYMNYKIRQNITPQTYKLYLIYSSATAIMLVIFGTERDFCIISDYRNSFNNKLKTYKRAKNFFNPANKKSLAEESVKEKRHTFIGICSLFI